VHGENDGLGGLVVDRYGDVAVLKLYSAAWFPHLGRLVGLLVERLAPGSIVLRLARNVAAEAPPRWSDGAALAGPLPGGPVPFLEHGLVFEADVVHGQKTGWFLDQRQNRLAVRGMSSGRRVLDVFCAGGGFSVNAAAGGATAVEGIDRSAGAVAAARRNMAANAGRPAVAACRHTTTVGDAAEEMARLAARGRRFDLVVVDPPALAARRAQVPRALEAYGRLAELALGLLEPGGTLLQASCTARVGVDDLASVVERAAGRVGVAVTEVARSGHAPDHPVGFAEGRYLDALTVRTDRPRPRPGDPRGSRDLTSGVVRREPRS
jgi:23S rRNA (cytosine1962-C5)-methyltransferase